MDAFKRALHATVNCTGGIYCPWDRPRNVTGHAGQRRLRDSKARSRRHARGALKMEARSMIEEALQDELEARLELEDEEAMRSLDESYYQDYLDYKYDQLADSDILDDDFLEVLEEEREIDWSLDPAYFTDWGD